MPRAWRRTLGSRRSPSRSPRRACGASSGVVDRAGRSAADGADHRAAPATDEPTPDDHGDHGRHGDHRPPTRRPPTAPSTLEWQEFDEQLETAILEVPVDYDDPDGPTFELFLARRLADDQENKIGSLLVNPGGPGLRRRRLRRSTPSRSSARRCSSASTSSAGIHAAPGYSEPAIDCIDDYDQYFAGNDITPDDDAERQQIVDLARGVHRAVRRATTATSCSTSAPTTRPATWTRSAGRSARRRSATSGSATAASSARRGRRCSPRPCGPPCSTAPPTRRPTRWRAACSRRRGSRRTLTTYLAQCSADTECAFHNGGDAEGAFDELMASLDEHPIPSEPGRPDVNRGVARQAVVEAMYSDGFWDQLSEALAAAQDGDGAGLLALCDAYYQRQPDGTWGNELEAFQAISCMDQVERPTVEESDAAAAEFNEAAPRFSPGTTATTSARSSRRRSTRASDITGAGAGPIVVIGTTGDPATPLDSTRAMAAALEDGRLVVVTADQHTGYGVNDCVDDVVHDYLIDLEPSRAATHRRDVQPLEY